MMESYIQSALAGGQVSAGLILMVLGAGLLTSFTPCVYPMVPITASIVGRLSNNRTQAVMNSVLYVLGLAVVYALLGVLAASTGHLFGSIASHPIALLFVALLCALFGLGMLGWIPIPQWSPAIPVPQNRLGRPLVTFAMGAASGLVMAPCTSPVLGILLIYVAAQGEPLWGALLMFIFAFGMSSLLILVGSFSGAVSALPKAGAWMNIVKYILAALMMVSAAYFASLAFQ
ncbi:cytochrome c biogenesis protein CcdA [Marinimicrobium sp. ABcell2]|uniref:cytochrome c biogenesis protein CcdA n=1 Tax=Marinimicrobium sp. ABcell2 TaxID=3069751 RepID=UPI0027B0418D|nr:cytochrome c biogenesis protein CcdA [Marinimicrobium sp. ABcell2]MDQ2076882.1 cytochrome c biogenesis protein CcdA [Marinimicrobium sp. ABcell2]